MPNFNKVILIGHLGSDPESKQVGEKTVVNFSLATNRKVKGEKVTDWHKIIVWGQPAEFAKTYFHKGDAVLVEGTVIYRSWEQDGQKKYITEIQADRVAGVSTKNEEDQPFK